MRLQVKGKAIFGEYYGIHTDGQIKFWDEELDKIVLYPKSKLEITYDK